MNAANDNTPFRKFAIGRRYSCRSMGDHDLVFSFEVVDRTDKTVVLKDSSGKVKRRAVRPSTCGRYEICLPHGRYSMAAVLGADDEVMKKDAS
jgi:hypothetical protein